jgi:hypothetical protein
MADDESQSELPAVRPFTWSDDDAVDFEVALDTISRVLAACSARYWAERRKLEPNPVVVERWRAEQIGCARASQALRADDQEAVAAVTARYRQRLRELASGEE